MANFRIFSKNDGSPHIVVNLDEVLTVQRAQDVTFPWRESTRVRGVARFRMTDGSFVDVELAEKFPDEGSLDGEFATFLNSLDNATQTARGRQRSS